MRCTEVVVSFLLDSHRNTQLPGETGLQAIWAGAAPQQVGGLRSRVQIHQVPKGTKRCAGHHGVCSAQPWPGSGLAPPPAGHSLSSQTPGTCAFPLPWAWLETNVPGVAPA